MPIASGIPIPESAATLYVSSTAADMLHFVDRFSGKRWHVRCNSGPGGSACADEKTQATEAERGRRRKTNNRGCEMVERSETEKISLSMSKSKICYDNNSNSDSGNNINCHYHVSSRLQYHHHHHLYRHRSHHHLSRRRYHQQRDTADEDDNNNDNENNDDKNDTSNKNNDNDHNNDDDETYFDAHLHPRLPRFYNRLFCRMNNDDVVNVPVDIDRIRIHRTETTIVHPLVQTSSTTTATTTANDIAVVTATTTITNTSVVAAVTKRCKIPPYLAILLLSYTLFGITDACSSRSTPKPRPPTPTDRPNITFHMYTCPSDYAEWYCLNGATCFTVKIIDSLLYNCLCANGYIGQRCEFKDLEGSYLPSRQRVLLETASIAGGATIAIFLVIIICIAAYIHWKRKQKELRSSNNCADTVDGPGRDPELRPFSSHSLIFMAKNHNSSPTIEQTKMPNCPGMESTKMESINEKKRSNQ